MTTAVLIVGAALVLFAAAMLVLALRMSARARAREAETETVQARLAQLEESLEQVRLDRSLGLSKGDDREYVITSLGASAPEDRPAAPALPAPAFADAILRDTVVHTAALAHGVRRALSAESRNRIRFEIKREVRRNRKARKAEVREAVREYRARHRAEIEFEIEEDAV